MSEVVDLSPEKGEKLIKDKFKPPLLKNGLSQYFHIGELVYDDSPVEYAWLVYTYTSENQVTPTNTYLCTVDMLSEKVECTYNPIRKRRLKYFQENKYNTALTKEEALDLLKEECEPEEKDRIIYYKQIDKFIKEDRWSFSWLVYPYTSKQPINQTLAYKYTVCNLGKKVTCCSHPLSQRLLKFHLSGIMERDLTKEEALELLKEECKPVEEDRIIYYKHIGEFTGKHSFERNGKKSISFNWLVYYYSSKSSIDKDYAFMYYVYNDTEYVYGSSAPLLEEELKSIREEAIKNEGVDIIYHIYNEEKCMWEILN